MKKIYFFLLAGAMYALVPTLVQAQASACPQVDAGPDANVCTGQCTNLNAIVQGSVSTSSYTTQPIPYNPYSYTTGTQVLINIDDTWSPAISMPFCFEFFGNVYNSFVIGSNGVISFNTGYANGWCEWSICTGIPSNATCGTGPVPLNSIMAPWHDVDPSAGSSSDVRYQTYGVAPCREMVISWYNVPMYSSSCDGNSSLNATQQIVLHETTNIIDIYIQNKQTCTQWNSGYAVEGIQDASGTVAYVVPGRNYPTQWSATNDGYRFVPGGAPNYTIQWLDPSNNVVGNTNTINVCPTTTTTYTAQVTNTTCAGPPIVVTDQVTVTVTPAITANPGSNSPLCPGNTLNLTSAGGGSAYTWTGPNGFNSNLQNPNIPNATNANSGTYTVQVTSPSGCTSTGTVSVTVDNPVPNAASNAPICEGANLNLTSGAGTNWSWSGPNGFNSTQQNPTITGATTAASGTYTVTVTGTGGCTSSGTVSVTVNPNPQPNVSANTPLCAGATLNLGSGAGTGWNWSGPSGFNSNVQNPTLSNVTTAASGTYTVTVTGTGGCTATDSVQVTVNPLPVPNPGSNTPICAGTNLNLTSGAGTGWSWSGPNGFNSTQQNPTISGATTAASGTYTVTVTGTGGCTASSTVSVTVNPVPVPAAGSNSPLCTGNTLNLTSGAGTGWTWSGPNGFNSNLQNPSIPNATTAASGTYTVTVTAAGGCTATDTVNVSVINAPVPNPGSNSPVCSGTSLNLTSGAGTGWSWTGPNGFNSNLQNPVINGVTPAASGTYTVVVTASGGCTASGTLTVNVNTTPVANASSNSPVCEGDNLNLTSGAGNSWNWSGPNGFNSNLQNPVITSVPANGSGDYIVTVTAANGCTATDTVNVVVNPLPVPNATSDAPLCAGDDLHLASGNGTGWAWTGPNGFNSSQQNPTLTSATTNASGTYSVVVTGTGGCTASGTVSVTVNPLPAVNLGADTTTVCENASLNLNGGTGASYQWSTGATTQTIDVDTTGLYWVNITSSDGCVNGDSIFVQQILLPAPSLDTALICQGDTASLWVNSFPGETYLWETGSTDTIIHTAMPGTYWVQVTNSCGTGTSTGVVILKPSFTVGDMPNILTPNGDGANDEYQIASLVYAESFVLNIYDRWGRLKFSTSDYTVTWKGEGDNGIVPEGTYFVVLDYLDCYGEQRQLNSTISVFK